MKEVSLESGLTDSDVQDSDDAAVVQATALSEQDARQIDSVTIMRIYDMLGAILTHLDEDMANAVLEAHADGKLVGPPPYLNI